MSIAFFPCPPRTLTQDGMRRPDLRRALRKMVSKLTGHSCNLHRALRLPFRFSWDLNLASEYTILEEVVVYAAIVEEIAERIGLLRVANRECRLRRILS